MNQAFSVERIEGSFSSIYRCWLFHDAAEVPGTLFETLKLKLPHLNAAEIPERVAWGGVFVNGIEVNIDGELPVPCKLEYYEPRFPIASAGDYFPQFSPEMVLYEDKHLIALFKPAKLPVYPGKEQKYYNVKVYVERYTGAVPHLPSRLDMSTCGVILISRHPEMHRPLQRLYEHSLIRKMYILGTQGEVSWSTHDHQGAIGKDPRHAVLRKVVAEGGKPSRTIFTRLGAVQDGELGERTFLSAQPLTGRTHQIRVHSSDLGHPIVGDNFYGGMPHGSLHLMAYSLTFRHPLGGEELFISVPERLRPAWLPPEIILPGRAAPERLK